MFGFILTRHVTNDVDAQYWIECIRCIREKYALTPVVVIDDNSPRKCPPCPYRNVVVLSSEFPKRGELLPYYYLLKYRWFDKAVILHDSVFIKQYINFDAYDDQPLWDFVNTMSVDLVHTLADELPLVIKDQVTPLMTGCFGMMGVVNLSTVDKWQEKYQFTKLLAVVTSRFHRCACERIFGLFYGKPSIFGNIWNYQFGLKFDEYKKGQNKCKFIVKVWSGR